MCMNSDEQSALYTRKCVCGKTERYRKEMHIVKMTTTQFSIYLRYFTHTNDAQATLNIFFQYIKHCKNNNNNT